LWTKALQIVGHGLWESKGTSVMDEGSLGKRGWPKSRCHQRRNILVSESETLCD
jgi:hypothetical protein